MPGTPDPVLGSEALTWGIAFLLSALIVGGFVYVASRWTNSTVVLTALGAGVYGLFAVGLWAGVRLVFHQFALSPVTEPLQFAWLIVVAGGVIAVYAVIPFYLFARFTFVAPMIGFTAISTFLLFLFLRVGGESDPLGLFGVGFAPVFFGVLIVLGFLEAGVRYVVM